MIVLLEEQSILFVQYEQSILFVQYEQRYSYRIALTLIYDKIYFDIHWYLEFTGSCRPS